MSTNDDQLLLLMPFRPYKRFVSERIAIADVSAKFHTEALTAQAEEAELEANGGRRAVLNSIRRHIPSFDPAQATSPYAPAWAKLKPHLMKAGLNPVDENTTLTEIKVFLDDLEPSPSSGRLGENTPASNFQTMADLIGPAEIVAVFDPLPGKRLPYDHHDHPVLWSRLSSKWHSASRLCGQDERVDSAAK